MYRTNQPEGHEGDALPFKIFPAHILACGLHVPLRKSQEILSPGEYQVYLYHVLEPLDSSFYFAYGNLPHVPIDFLSIENSIGIYSVPYICTSSLHLCTCSNISRVC